MMQLRQPFERSDPVRPLLNVGARFDIVTGTCIKGRYDETIISGGLATLTAVVGLGNQFKTKTIRYQLLSALSKFYQFGSTANSYDTESNVHEEHQRDLTHEFEPFQDVDIIGNGTWVITDKSVYTGDQYFDLTKDFLNEKVKNRKSISKDTPFLNRDGTAMMQMIIPTFRDVDSFSEFTTQDVIKMQDDNVLGDSGANTIFMREGLQKNRFLREISSLADKARDYVLLTAHLGSEFNLDPRQPAPKKLAHLRGGIKIKGAPEKFTFLTNVCWYNMNSTPLINRGTRGPEYPRDKDDNLKDDTDLNEVTIKLLRNKTGPSGMNIEVVISQSEGLLEDLTNFHYIRMRKYYGLVGGDRNYHVALKPDVNLSRTTVRTKLKEDKLLCRAIELTADLCQVMEYWPQYENIMTDPETLYKDIKDLGYDWDILLNTRSWWTFDNDKQDIPFLSIIDLLRMRVKEYVPYWYKDLPEKVKDVPRIDRLRKK